MNILVVTTEIGTDGGGMALSCRRIVDILQQNIMFMFYLLLITQFILRRVA